MTTSTTAIRELERIVAKIEEWQSKYASLDTHCKAARAKAELMALLRQSESATA